ncbi:hypothetical protein [Pararcticibacter amylolyticus]|uniref:3-keto-disaccharide hydrolase domain-containing protein n=1 Tax=Pararcticibacter amylolyticus TaxID=2173175 RepID=A0A2U2PJS9_9SPHI|nr:hypothetical protein [Pararcticibacter amylolyticus]PWG81399.1 hypothetical protein DDR33_06035 [Pararcticibacter amylolyticus]
MNRFNKTGICAILICCAFNALGQKPIRVPLKKNNLRAVNREIEILSDEHKGRVVRVNAANNPGVVWINDLHFKSGSIEFDVKGKDVLQESFVGVAFHGSNDSTYESVYCRPFNFNAKDSVRKAHAVQYIALPDYDWPYLRKNFPGKYEAPVNSFIDPNDWFHVKVEVSGKLIRVFINGDRIPLPEIPPLREQLDGKVGFWVGDGSDGAFSNLVITGGQWFKK